MRIRVVSVCRNEQEILPWFLRHYQANADEIVLYDDHSTDRTREIAQTAGAYVLDWPYPSGLFDDQMMELWQSAKAKAKGNVDWVMFPDIDEFLYHPDGLHWLLGKIAVNLPFDVIASEGWNMTGDGLPKDDGKSQIWELLQTGVRAPVYSKPIIVRSQAEVNWNRGRHALEGCKPMVSRPLVKLLHYRYLGYDYTAKRNARNYERVGEDKGCAWSCAPSWKGEHSPEWAEKAKHRAVNALEAPL